MKTPLPRLYSVQPSRWIHHDVVVFAALKFVETEIGLCPVEAIAARGITDTGKAVGVQALIPHTKLLCRIVVEHCAVEHDPPLLPVVDGRRRTHTGGRCLRETSRGDATGVR